MHVQEISYTGTYHLGDHNFEKIACSFHLNEGEDEQFALKEAKRVVQDFHNNRPSQDSNRDTYINQPLPEINIDKNSREFHVSQLLTDINTCKESKVLETYNFLRKQFPEINDTYIQKNNQLLGEAIDKNGGPY
jgi:hypothetical protein